MTCLRKHTQLIEFLEREQQLGNTSDYIVHHVDSFTTVLLVRVHKPVLQAVVNETRQPSLDRHFLHVLRLVRIVGTRRIHTVLVHTRQTRHAQVLRAQRQRLLLGVHDRLFSSICYHVTNDSLDEGWNILIYHM